MCTFANYENNAGSLTSASCSVWADVVCNTGVSDWGYQLENPAKYRLDIYKGERIDNCPPGRCNPIVDFLKNPRLSDARSYVLGFAESGKDPEGLVVITVIAPNTTTSDRYKKLSAMTNSDPRVKYFDISAPGAALVYETGYHDENLWLDWMYFTAISNNLTNFIACSTARPTLTTLPAPLFPTSNKAGSN